MTSPTQPSKITFRLNKMDCSYKRSDLDHKDNDVITFLVTVEQNGTTTAYYPSKKSSNEFEIVDSGQTILLYDDPKRQDEWQIGPISVYPDSNITFTYSVMNLSYAQNHDPQAVAKFVADLAENAIQIASAIISVPDPTLGAVIEVADLVGSFLLDKLGILSGQPNCDGLVAASPSNFQGHLENFNTQGQVPGQPYLHQTTNTYHTDGCGHNPEYTVYYSIQIDEPVINLVVNVPPPSVIDRFVPTSPDGIPEMDGNWLDWNKAYIPLSPNVPLKQDSLVSCGLLRRKGGEIETFNVTVNEYTGNPPVAVFETTSPALPFNPVISGTLSFTGDRYAGPLKLVSGSVADTDSEPAVSRPEIVIQTDDSGAPQTCILTYKAVDQDDNLIAYCLRYIRMSLPLDANGNRCGWADVMLFRAPPPPPK